MDLNKQFLLTNIEPHRLSVVLLALLLLVQVDLNKQFLLTNRASQAERPVAGAAAAAAAPANIIVGFNTS